MQTLVLRTTKGLSPLNLPMHAFCKILWTAGRVALNATDLKGRVIQAKPMDGIFAGDAIRRGNRAPQGLINANEGEKS